MRQFANVRRAVFLDRDGVLNRVVIRKGLPFPPASLAHFALYDDVPDGCARLKKAGFLLVVVTNQPDVGRGTMRRVDVDAVHSHLFGLLPLDRIEVCCHAGEKYGEQCDCRKPKPGMLLRAAAALQIDRSTSYMVGDRWRDIDCAHDAGCKSIFIERNYSETLRLPPDFIVQSFAQAVEIILADA